MRRFAVVLLLTACAPQVTDNRPPGEVVCPATPPNVGDACSASCVYDVGSDCLAEYDCSDGGFVAVTVCDPPPPCPTDPAPGDACSAIGQKCPASSCGGGWVCSSDGWQNAGETACPTCPETLPAAGAPCEAPQQACDYTVETECGPMDAGAVCDAGSWVLTPVSGCQL